MGHETRYKFWKSLEPKSHCLRTISPYLPQLPDHPDPCSWKTRNEPCGSPFLRSFIISFTISKVLAAGAEGCGKKRGKKDDRSAPHEGRMKAAEL